MIFSDGNVCLPYPSSLSNSVLEVSTNLDRFYKGRSDHILVGAGLGQNIAESTAEHVLNLFGEVRGRMVVGGRRGVAAVLGSDANELCAVLPGDGACFSALAAQQGSPTDGKDESQNSFEDSVPIQCFAIAEYSFCPIAVSCYSIEISSGQTTTR
jgi:hypothetical protein